MNVCNIYCGEIFNPKKERYLIGMQVNGLTFQVQKILHHKIPCSCGVRIVPENYGGNLNQIQFSFQRSFATFQRQIQLSR